MNQHTYRTGLGASGACKAESLVLNIEGIVNKLVPFPCSSVTVASSVTPRTKMA